MTWQNNTMQLQIFWTPFQLSMSKYKLTCIQGHITKILGVHHGLNMMVILRRLHVTPLVTQQAAMVVQHVVAAVPTIVVSSVSRHLVQLTSLPGMPKHGMRLGFARYGNVSP